MRRTKRRAKPGFALLEAMVFVLLMLLLGTAMLAAAYNMHRRSLERAENDRAYNAAVAALKIVGDDICQNAADADYAKNNYEGERTYTLDLTPEGEAAQAYAQITMQGAAGKITLDGQEFDGLRLTATATVAGETETVELTMQRAGAEAYPHTLYGAGFAGYFSPGSLSDPPALTLGPDTDLYLYGGTAPLELAGLSAGGNVAAQGLELTLRDSSVAGSVVSDSPLTLENTLVGGSDTLNRLSNVYSSASVALRAGTAINGNVYAPAVSSRGSVQILADPTVGSHNIYCTEKQLDEFTVFDAEGSGHLTTDQTPQNLSRTGTLTFGGSGRWVSLAAGALQSPFPGGALRMFVPNFPVDISLGALTDAEPPAGALNARGVLYQVPKGGMLTLNSAQGVEGTPAVFVVLEENATLYLSGAGPYYLCVYGQGPQAKSIVKAAGGAAIYGSLQGVELEVVPGEHPNALTINYVQPSLAAYQAPSSAGYSQDVWRVVGYERIT